MTLRDAWEEHAGDWIRWARAPDHDHFYWRMTRPALLALLPPPGRLTLDVGCGEGRLARELTMTFHDRHRPLSAYFGALEAAGFAVEALREPVPDDEHVAAHADAARWRETPVFLQLRARRAP